MGKIFGSKENAPGNIAGFAVIVSMTMLAILLIWGNDAPSLSKKDAVLVIAGFVSLSLGFLFGRASH